MANRSPLPHEQIVAYLRGASDKGTHAQILKLREEDPAYHALFDLIDEFRNQANFHDKPAASSSPSTFSAIEELLMRLYSGEAGSEEARQLIGGLTASPVFYQRLLRKLAAIAPQTAPEEAPELAPITMKTENEILALILAGPQAKSRPPIAGGARRSLSGFIANILQTVLQPVHDFFERVPRYALAVPLVIIAAAVIFQHAFEKDIDDRYVYDDDMPYRFAGGLRGPSSFSKNEALFEAFESAFKLGMSDYVVYRYAAAINILQNLDSLAFDLQTQFAHDKKVLQTIRDYDFYLGVSHFALARSKQADLTREEKAQHFNSAIRFLARADSLARAQHFADNDREIFFLGLAYGFGGQPESAVFQLRQLKPESEFYEQSAGLIKDWSGN